MTDPAHPPDPRLDLVLERSLEVRPDLVWQAWTRPEYLKKWFTPAPWTTAECEIDLRPGGMFRTVLRSPEGEQASYVFCYLEVAKNEKLVWTAALAPGYRPAAHASEVPAFTAVLTLEPHANGTRYRVVVMHQDEAGRAKHEQMGFHDGWGAAFEQMVALLKTL